MYHLIFFGAAGGSLTSDLANMAGETAEKFDVNWPAFLSQLLSFILVCILLHKFAYKPILRVLEDRRQRIAEGLANAEKIKQQLADSEKRYAEILANANLDAQKMIDEARQSAEQLAERGAQQAIVEAEQILTKAREAAQLEHDRMFAELKREVGRLVIDTTAKVTGKILTPEDQKRLTEETARQVAV